MIFRIRKGKRAASSIDRNNVNIKSMNNFMILIEIRFQGHECFEWINNEGNVLTQLHYHTATIARQWTFREQVMDFLTKVAASYLRKKDAIYDAFRQTEVVVLSNSRRGLSIAGEDPFDYHEASIFSHPYP